MCIRDRYMRQQTGAGQASGDGPARCGGLNDDIANGASEFRADMPDDPEAGGYILKHFGDIFAEFLQRTAAVRARAFRRGMPNAVPRQMLRLSLIHI